MSPFGWWIAVYFALATLAAGAAGAACGLIALNRKSPADDEPARIRLTLMIAIAAIFAGSGALVADLERPGEFYLILTSYEPGSWISRGSRIISAFGLVAFALLSTQWSGIVRSWWAYGLALALGSLALLVAIYPAFVLDQAVGRPLWQSAWLPVLFFSGAVHIGLTIYGAPRSLELTAIAAEIALLAAYALAIGPGRLAAEPIAYGLLALAALGSWTGPLLLSAERRWARVALIALGTFGIRGAILFAGQRVINAA